MRTQKILLLFLATILLIVALTSASLPNGSVVDYQPFNTSISDLSLVNMAWINAGTPSIITSPAADVKWGIGSVYLPGNTGTTQLLYSTNTSNFNFGTNNFTVAFWFNETASHNNYDWIVGNAPYGSGAGWSIGYGASGGGTQYNIQFARYIGSWTSLFSTTSFSTLNTWHYIVCERSGNTFSIYVDGVLNGTSTSASTIGSTTQYPSIGGQYGVSAAYGATGYLDDLIVYNGIAIDGTKVPDREMLTNPNAGFASSATSGTAPLTVSITNTSAGNVAAQSWAYYIHNLTATSDVLTSTSASPTISNLPGGNYILTQVVSNTFGSSNATLWINVTSPPPVANFIYTPTSGSTPLAVAFTDTSQTSITAWNWTFGAANYSSLQNPSYTFVGGGNYSVTLNVTNASGTNSTTKYVLVNSIADPNPNSMIKYKTSQSIVNIDNQTPYVGTGVIRNISSNTTQVISNFTWNPAYVSISNIRVNQSSVNITGLSIDSYAIHNDLGYAIVNESKASGFVAPANATFDFNITYIKYAAPGTSIPFSFDSSSEYYDVGNSTYWHFNTITGANAIIGVWGPIGANFSANATTVAVGSPLAFSDTSTGYPDAWSWDFGDGSTSSAQNPVYSYATTGLKNVALHAYMSENGTITNTITKTNYINVTAAPPPAPVADFTGTPTTVSLGTTVQFNDTSAYSPTSWSWNFGDSGGSSLQNPTHLYTSIGVYNVSLTATNAQGSSTATKTNYINVTALAPPVASFTSNVTSGGIPLPVQFTDTTSNIPTSWLWTFGDTGATSTSQNPSHTFTTAGNWSVSLKATNAAGNNTVIHYINATTLSGFTRQDLVMAPQYTLTINFVDSVTNLAIPVVKVVNAADGTSVNITTGTYTGTFGYTTAVLYCYSDGYAAKSVSYIMTGDLTETVQLTQSTTSQTQNTNVVYSPTMVQFLFYNENLKTISNAYVIATPINFTAPSNWTSLLLGISSGCNILGTSVYGWTDVAGSWSAPMVASVDYSMTVAGTEGGTPFNYTFTIYPVQSPVHITLPIGITAMPTPSQISYGLNHTAVNTTMQTVVMNYYDPSGETTILNFYITNTTGALLASGNYTGSSANSASFYQNITVATRGQAYTYGFTANQGTLGWINRSDSFVDPSFSLLGSGFTPGVVELWFSIALLVIFGAVGSFYFKHIILIAEPILYWFIASYLSWLPLNTNVYLSLAVMLVLGVLIYIRYRENMIQ